MKIKPKPYKQFSRLLKKWILVQPKEIELTIKSTIYPSLKNIKP